MIWGEFLWGNIQAAKKKNPEIELFHYRDKKKGCYFEVGFTEIEKKSVFLTQIRITKKNGLSIGDLEQMMNLIIKNIKYLEENFTALEVTPRKTILRSEKPYSTNGGQKEFYEITITPASILLQRWIHKDEEKNLSVFTLSHRTFVRLINDLTFALNIG